MPEKILLIDGMYLVFSSFYSHRNMNTLKGDPTGAVYGFVTRVEALIRELNPDFIAVAFDSREKNFRAQRYPEYKAKRQAPPEELLQQVPLIKEFLQAREIPFFETPGFEADDIIAHLSRKWAAEREVVIFSADKDLFQLIGPNVTFFHPKLKHELDREEVKRHFGVYPEQVVDYLLLVGDASDNIPGVKGIGEKTAVKLLEQFGSVEQMVNRLDQLDSKNAERIRGHMPDFPWTRDLLDLSRIPKIPGDYRLDPFANSMGEKLLEFYRRLSFDSLIKKTIEARGTDKKENPALPIRYHIVRDPSGLAEVKRRLLEKRSCGIDVETTAIDFFKAEMVGFSIAFADAGYYIPLRLPKNEIREGFPSRESLVQELKPALEDPRVSKTGHNIKFDMLHLRQLGIRLQGVGDDTMVLSYLIYPNRRAHGLKDLSTEFLDYRPVEYAELVGKGRDIIPMEEVPLDRIGRYCIEDSYLSCRLAGKLKEKLEEKCLLSLYQKIEIPLVTVLVDMEYAGVSVDRPFLLEAQKKLLDRMGKIEEAVYALAGGKFNLNSSQQLGELLFVKMNLPMGKKTKKTKVFSTDIDVLMDLKGFPIVERIIEYRTTKKLLSTYVEGLLEASDGNDRVHTSFNQAVTATGRLSSSNPNLQNIPVGEMAGVNLRRAFVAEKGWKLLSADYSQIELRVMAHFSGDEELIEAFCHGLDIHQHTADQVFGPFSLQAENRRRAKIINFSIIYGSGPFSLSKELGVGIGEAKTFIDKYFATYRGVKEFMEKTIAEAGVTLEVHTLSGRMRPIPEIASQNRTIRENGQRMAVNTIIQGSAADIIKMAMLDVHEKLFGMRSRLLLQVHDELVFEYPPEEEKKLCRIVRKSMENAAELAVPLTVSLKSGLNWGDLEPING